MAPAFSCSQMKHSRLHTSQLFFLSSSGSSSLGSSFASTSSSSGPKNERVDLRGLKLPGVSGSDNDDVVVLVLNGFHSVAVGFNVD